MQVSDKSRRLKGGEDRFLERCDSYFYDIGQSIDAIVWAADPDGTLVYSSTKFLQSFGKNLVGTKAWSWEDLIHSDDLKAMCEGFDYILANPDWYEGLCRMRMRDGEYRPFKIRAGCVRRKNNEVYRWVGSCVRADLPNAGAPKPDEHYQYIMGTTAEMRESESAPEFEVERSRRRLEFLAEASAELTSSLDIRTILQNLARLAVPRIADWVGVMELMPDKTLVNYAHFHRDPGLFYVGWTISIKYPPAQPAEYGSYRVLATGKAQVLPDIPYDVLQKIARSDAATKGLQIMGHQSVIVAPLKARGRILGTVSFTTAQSGRRYDEADLRLAEEFAQRLALAIDHAKLYQESLKISQAKDEFLAALSHELRTPLNVIMGNSELLLGNWQGMPTEEIQSSIEAVSRNAKSQLQIVQDLLDVSSIILGKVRLSLERVPIIELVEHCIENIRPSLLAKQQTITLNASNAPKLVTADSGRLQQVVMNLLTNAVKYTQDGGSIEVGLEEQSGDLLFSVRDNGVGIDPDFLPYVFERFQQENYTTTRTYGGLGLGLSIVRNIVELHGGRVDVVSQGRNRGSRFTVTLPVGSDETAATVVDTTTANDASIEKIDLSGVRILLVEDDKDTRTLVRRFLEKSNAQVFEASSAAQGFQMLRLCQPHLILSDIGMPEEDGISFIRRVRALELELEKFTPAAALTAFTRPEDGEMALNAGFQLHVAKPVNRAKLVSSVAELLEKHRITSWLS